MAYDVVIVGGGSAGCVLASRLSEDPSRTVLLLEAGPDYRSQDQVPDDLANAAYGPPSHNWEFLTEPHRDGAPVFIPRGKVIGGSSSINYCFAPRARPADHDAWVEAGNDGWGYEDMLPYYRAMESYAHGEDKWHGRSGPYLLSRADDGEISEPAAAFVEAATSLGHPFVDDLNAPTDVKGVHYTAFSAVDGVRQSTAVTFLALARGRDNLEVRGEAVVDRVMFDGARAVGVRLADGEVVEARHVVLSAGAYQSPAVLMRSGIGPAARLSSLGIDVVVDAPGVGQNLMEHPAVYNRYAGLPPTRGMGALFQAALNIHSGDPEETDYDLQIYPSGAVPDTVLAAMYDELEHGHPTGWDVFMLVACVQPRSRGTVDLRSPDPHDAPVIHLGMYDDPRDAAKVAQAVRAARVLARTSPFDDYLVQELWPGEHIPDEDLETWVAEHPAVFHHASGTARMGGSDDPMAVVDADCSVHHVDGLSVVDASVFPHIPRVATNSNTIVTAERSAERLRTLLPKAGSSRS